MYEDLLRIELIDITDDEDIAIIDGFSDFALLCRKFSIAGGKGPGAYNAAEQTATCRGLGAQLPMGVRGRSPQENFGLI
jgi:hypothetical protein